MNTASKLNHDNVGLHILMQFILQDINLIFLKKINMIPYNGKFYRERRVLYCRFKK